MIVITAYVYVVKPSLYRGREIYISISLESVQLRDFRFSAHNYNSRYIIFRYIII